MSGGYIETSIDLEWDEVKGLLGQLVTVKGIEIGIVDSIEYTMRTDHYPQVQYRLGIQGMNWVDTGSRR